MRNKTAQIEQKNATPLCIFIFWVFSWSYGNWGGELRCLFFLERAGGVFLEIGDFGPGWGGFGS